VNPSCSKVDSAPGVEETGWHRRGVLRVALDPTATEPGDQPQRARQAGGGRALATVSLADEAAGDPPVRELGQPLLVGDPVLDPGHLLGRTELAPADALVAVEDEGCVRRALADPRELPVAVVVGAPDVRVSP
jgi:hypothetical protein